MMSPKHTDEHKRLADSDSGQADWRNWGPYLSERAWGTVREDYSPGGEAWDYFPHDHARSRAYRWNEDGLGGFCNRYQNICLSVALWNGQDPIMKERLFGLSGNEGNHGEDVKEYYYYLDGTPTHAYMKMLYKYPQVTFPNQDLVEQNCARGRDQAEYELIDALREAFEDNRYFDVFIEYAKADEEDCFFYDALHDAGEHQTRLKVRSFVGLIPLFATAVLEADQLKELPGFKQRLEWFMEHRPELVKNVASFTKAGAHGHTQLSIVDREKLERILKCVFDTNEFLSDYGLRSLSKYHAQNPFRMRVGEQEHSVGYEPAESRTWLFGGNSNWRGPVWFPLNYLVIESLRTYHHHYGDDFKIEVPGGSGNWINLDQAADELCRRLGGIFLRDPSNGGRRPVFGDEKLFQRDLNWRDHVLFYEYFHGDTGAGLGASHQTGWTALVAKMMQDTRANH